MNRKILFLLLAAGIMLLAFWSVGQAQDAGFEEFEPIVVEGQIQRPHAFYIIRRAGMEFGIQAKKRSFIHMIEESIEGEPF